MISEDRKSNIIREFYCFGAYRLDPRDRVFWRDQEVVRLTSKEFDVLLAIARRAGAPADKYLLMQEVWPENPRIDENNLSQQIRALRRKLGTDARDQQYIRNISNQGYFIPGVVTRAEEIGIETKLDISIAEGTPEELPQADTKATADQPARSGYGLPTRGVLIAITAILLVLSGLAAYAAAYGLAIVLSSACCLLAAVVHTRSEDTAAARGVTALLVTAVMAYIPSASSLGEVAASVVNATTLKPSVVYPLITGLKFIPLFVLVFAYWVLLGAFGNAGFRSNSVLRRAYTLLGPLFLLLTAVLLVRSSGDDRIWQAALPRRQWILAGYAVVVLANIGVWLAGYVEFNSVKITSYGRFLFVCIVAYVPLAAAGLLVDETYNWINTHYLDKRRPEAYVAGSPEALEHFKVVGTDLESDIGPDLRSLIEDPAFRKALRTQHFYKQDFDELFQLRHKAVMFGYKAGAENRKGAPPRFVIVRFPEKMAAALRFQVVSE